MLKSHFRWIALAALPLVFSIAVPNAQAQDAATTSAARQLVVDGMADFKAKKFQEATTKLERAYGAMKVPSVALWSARALEKNGKLVEAAERYLEATRLSAEKGNKKLQLEAQTLARKERAALLPRIPKLTVSVKGAPKSEVTVEVGRRSVTSSLLGVAMPNNPGDFEVVARWGEQEQRASVSLKEGGAERVSLTFEETPVAAAAPSPGSTGSPAEQKEPAIEEDSGTRPEKGSTARTLGWISLGIGGVGLAFGGVTYFMAAGAKSDADAACGGSIDSCTFAADAPDSTVDDANSKVADYNSINKYPAIGFAVGGVGLVTGLVLLLSSGSSDEEQAARVTPWVGLGSAGVSGRF